MRRPLAGLLMVLATVLPALALWSTWAHREATDTDRFMATTTPLATDRTVQDAVGRELVDTAMARLQAAGVPNASALRGRLTAIADGLPGSPAYRRAWLSTQRTVHERLAARLTGATDDPLTLPLDRTASALRARVRAAGLPQVATLIPDPRPVVIATRSEVRRAQRATDAVKAIQVVTIPGALLALLGVVLTADGVARGLRRAGVCLTLSMILLLTAWALVRSGVAAADHGDLAAAVYDVVSRPLWRWALYGVAAGLLAVAAGVAPNLRAASTTQR